MKSPLRLCLFLLLFLCSNLLVSAQKTGNVSIRGAVKGMQENDSLRLCVWDGGLVGKFAHYLPPNQVYITTIKNQSFQFSIPKVKEASYFTLTLEKNAERGLLIFSYLRGLGMYSILEPNDDICLKMTIDSTTYRVGYGTGWKTDHFIKDLVATGKGCEKYNCIYGVEKEGLIVDSIFTERNRPSNKELIPKSTDAVFPHLSLVAQCADSTLKVQLKFLQTWKSKLDASMWEIVRANVIGFSNYDLLRAYLGIAPPENSARDKNSKAYLDSILERKDKDFFIPDSIAVKAIYYTYLLGNKIRKQNRNGNVYQFIKETYSGQLRDKLLTEYLVLFGRTKSNGDSLIADAMKEMEPGFLRDYIRELSKTIQRGVAGYNFSLTDQNGKTVQFSDLNGKVVFIDFWYTGCGACADYYREIVKKVEERFLHDPRILFVTISIDTDLDRWINVGLKSGNYTSHGPNVINLYTNGQGKNAEVIKYYNIVGYPSPMLFDRSGRIFSASWDSLRRNGVEGLVEQIAKALDEKML